MDAQESLNKLAKDVSEWLRLRVDRPIRKYIRRQQYLRRQDAIQSAMGELVDRLEPLMLKVLDETLNDYAKSMAQNHHTIQSRHDIRRLYEIKLKSYISSKK